jgi:anti-sigma factor RsiW
MTVPRRQATRRPASRRPAVAPASGACSEADQLWAYLDGELPAARSRAIARHVGACAACEARARRLRTMLETCRAAGCRKLPVDVRARARARVRALLATAHTKP